jgi:hypothetical protein
MIGKWMFALCVVTAVGCASSSDPSPAGDEPEVRSGEAGKACGPLNVVHPKCAAGFTCAIKGDSGVCVKAESEEGKACGPLNVVHPKCAAGFTCELQGDSGTCKKSGN